MGNLTQIRLPPTATLVPGTDSSRPTTSGKNTMPNIGPLEIAIVLVIVLLIFGPKRLPGLGKQLGTGMREFKDSITGKDKEDDDAPASRGSDRRDVEAALGRPEGEQTPLDGEA